MAKCQFMSVSSIFDDNGLYNYTVKSVFVSTRLLDFDIPRQAQDTAQSALTGLAALKIAIRTSDCQSDVQYFRRYRCQPVVWPDAEGWRPQASYCGLAAIRRRLLA